MGLGFISAGGIAGGQAALDAVLEKRLAAQYRAQQLQQQQWSNAQAEKQFASNEDYKNAQLADLAANRASLKEDRDRDYGGKLNEAMLGGTQRDASDPIVAASTKGGALWAMKGMDAQAPPALLAAPGDDQQPDEIAGTFPMSPLPGMGLRTVTKANSAAQQNTIDDNEQKRVTAEATERQRGVSEARQQMVADSTIAHQRFMEKKPTGGGSTAGMWVTRDGKPVRVTEAQIQPGDAPFSATATTNTTAQAEAADTAQEVSRIASTLRKHPGVGGAFGVYQSKMPTMRQDTADAEVLRESLTSLLTLENMGKMKGVLSDSDMKVLRSASSTIAAGMSDAAAAAELDRIVSIMNKVTAGNAGAGPGEVMYDMDGNPVGP